MNEQDVLPKILVVEDETEIRQLLLLQLRREGYWVEEAADGHAAVQRLNAEEFDLAILDWMLPGLSGVEITDWVRKQTNLRALPILMVTAKVSAEDVAQGLNAGADDYLAKPFDKAVLLARVKALLRRKRWLEGREEKQLGVPGGVLRMGGLEMDPSSYEVYLKGQPLDLTRSEFRLLQALLENQGRVLSREHLIEEIQGEGVNVVGRTVDTHVFGLRKKLNDHADMIETIRGVGYRIRYVSTNG